MTPMERAEHHFRPFWEKDFGAISSGPFFSRPLCFTADQTTTWQLLATLKIPWQSAPDAFRANTAATPLRLERQRWPGSLSKWSLACPHYQPVILLMSKNGTTDKPDKCYAYSWQWNRLQIAMRPEMITQIIRKHFFVYPMCVQFEINFQRIYLCNWHVHRKYLMKAPNYTKQFLPESPV